MSWLTSRYRSFSASALLAGASFLGLTACETTGDLTVDLPDTEPTSSTYIDLPVNAATVLLDPALTLKSDRFLVGRLRDQVTGLTEARAVLNLRPSNALADLPGQLKSTLPGIRTQFALDSVVLFAPFEQVYGTAAAPLRYDVFPLATKLSEQVVYTGVSDFEASSEAIATNLSAPLNATRQLTQPASDGSGTVITTVPNQLVRQVLQAPNDSPKPLFASIFEKMSASTFSQADLDALLAGIVLAPSAGYEGSIVGFGRSATTGAQLRFSFSYDSAQTAPLPPARKKRSYSLFFGPGLNSSGSGAASDPRYFTQLRIDRSGSQLAALSNQSQAVPAAALDGRSYLQAGTGLGTRITFSDLVKLEALRNTPGVAINRAELRVPVQPFTTGVFPYPPSFYALEVDAANQVLLRTVDGVPTERVVQRDGQNQQRNDFEASANLVDAGSTNPYYSMLITSYLQAYLTPNGLGPDQPLPAALVLTPMLRSTTIVIQNSLAKIPQPLTLNRAVTDANNIHLRVYYSQLR
ncbi:DUF4270 family protein [uncultured Hymenobacter sp.]|uniref:DUF4270 family protein n=1 Tax=uncultured Hymenobacter sp. TaxID=170016 RepID=UPI0035C957A7